MALLQQRPCSSRLSARLPSTRQRCTVVQCRASQPGPRLSPIQRRAKSPEELNDPAQIGATGSASQRFPVVPGSEPLQSYMTLPVEQYFVLDPKQFAHLGGNRFVLTVPRINLMSVWLEAVAEVTVTTYPPDAASGRPARVVLQADNCRISGSDLVENLALDQRFAMRFVTELTWSTSGGGEGAGAAAVAPTGEIRATSKLDVWSEVVPPFHLLPREVLVGSCNGVLHGLVGSLLPLFVRMLAADYQRWAVDPAYRADRAARSQPITV